MTRIMEQFCEMAISAFRKYLRGEIDWEQRRYEIAKQIASCAHNSSARYAVDKAEELIAELKKRPVKD